MTRNIARKGQTCCNALGHVQQRATGSKQVTECREAAQWGVLGAPTTQLWLPVRRQHRGLGKRSLPGFLSALHEASLFWDLQSSPTGPEGRMGIIFGWNFGEPQDFDTADIGAQSKHAEAQQAQRFQSAIAVKEPCVGRQVQR